MEEENKTLDEVVEKQPEEKKEEPVKSSKPITADEMNVAADRIEKANAEMRSLLQQQAAARREQAQSGTATASEPKKELTKEEKEIESARKFLEGTGYENQLFPKKEK